MKRILAASFVLLACSCSRPQTPSNVISPEKFETIYVELLDSSSVSQPAISDSTLSPTAERILQRKGITLEQFRSTVRYYNADSKKWKEFFTNVTNMIEERRTKKTAH